MAILSRYPGFEVTVEVDGNPLPEYDFVQEGAGQNTPVEALAAEADTTHNGNADSTPAEIPASTANENRNGDADAPPAATSIIKYIEAPLDKEFTIRYTSKPGFGYDLDRIYMEPSLDGKVIFIADVRYDFKDVYDSQICYGGELFQGNTMLVQRFRFSELAVVEEPTTDEMRRHMRDHGEIKVEFFFTEGGETIAATDLPQMTFEDTEHPVSVKAVKETLAATGYAPNQSASLAPPVSKVGGSSLEQVNIVGKLGTFIFKYRTTDALKSLGVIPRTPPPTPPRSPTPLWLRDENSMTVEELRQFIGDLRQMRQEEIRIKRERDDADEAVVDDNELQWIGTRPCPKRLRAIPTEDDEVISLED